MLPWPWAPCPPGSTLALLVTFLRYCCRASPSTSWAVPWVENHLEQPEGAAREQRLFPAGPQAAVRSVGQLQKGDSSHPLLAACPCRGRSGACVLQGALGSAPLICTPKCCSGDPLPYLTLGGWGSAGRAFTLRQVSRGTGGAGAGGVHLAACGGHSWKQVPGSGCTQAPRPCFLSGWISCFQLWGPVRSRPGWVRRAGSGSAEGRGSCPGQEVQPSVPIAPRRAGGWGCPSVGCSDCSMQEASGVESFPAGLADGVTCR